MNIKGHFETITRHKLLVMKYCFGTDTLTEELRDRYREHTVDIIMAGILAR